MTLTFGAFLVGSLLCTWAVLRCIGNERERRMIEIEARIKAEREARES